MTYVALLKGTHHSVFIQSPQHNHLIPIMSEHQSMGSLTSYFEEVKDQLQAGSSSSSSSLASSLKKKQVKRLTKKTKKSININKLICHFNVDRGINKAVDILKVDDMVRIKKKEVVNTTFGEKHVVTLSINEETFNLRMWATVDIQRLIEEEEFAKLWGVEGFSHFLLKYKGKIGMRVGFALVDIVIDDQG